MRVTLETEGGLAYFPGLAKPVTIDAAGLPDKVREELGRLLREKAQPATSPMRPDARRYTMTISADGQSHRLVLVEPIQDAQLLAVLNAIQAKIRESRNPG